MGSKRVSDVIVVDDGDDRLRPAKMPRRPDVDDRAEQTIPVTGDDLLLKALHRRAVNIETGLNGFARSPSNAAVLYESCIAEADHVPSMYRLALLLEHGDGVPRDVTRAIGLYRRGIERGQHVMSRVRLAQLLAADGATQDNILKAVQLFEQALPDDVSGLAAYNLGHILETGRAGVLIDMAKAANLYNRSFKQGKNTDAALRLAAMHESGAVGVPKDVKQAAWLYEQAANLGKNSKAMSSLAALLCSGEEGIPRDVRRALQLYELAIQQDEDVDALFNLGCLLEAGEGVEKDLLKAAAMFERAIEKDASVDAMIRLAILLQDGRDGVQYNPRRAVALYERAVKEGKNTVAMTNLALMFRTGAEGVPKDIPRAIKLLQDVIAAECFASDLTLLARLWASVLAGPLRNAARAKTLLERAVLEFLHAPAIHELELLLRRGGKGLAPDPARADKMHELLKTQGRNENDSGEYTTFHKHCIQLGRDCHALIEKTLRVAEVRTKQSSMIVLGESAAAKLTFVNSINAAVTGRPAANTPEPFLNQKWIVPGRRNLDTQALHELIFRNESLIALLSRIAEDYIPGNDQGKDARSQADGRRTAEGDGRDQTGRAEANTSASARDHDGDPVLPEGLLNGANGNERTRIIGTRMNSEALPVLPALPVLRSLPVGQQKDVPGGAFHANDKDAHMSVGGSKKSSGGRFPGNGSRAENEGQMAMDITRPEGSETARDHDLAPAHSSQAAGGHGAATRLGSQWATEILERARFGLTEYPFPEDEYAAIVHNMYLEGVSEVLRANALLMQSTKVAVFVLNLDTFENDATRLEEVGGLCHWMQLVHSVSRDPASVRPIIVGVTGRTNMNMATNWGLLQGLLERHLGDAVYDQWVRMDAKNDSAVRFAAFTSASGVSPSNSGLDRVEQAIKDSAASVVSRRPKVPARYFALMEYFEHLKRTPTLLLMKRDMVKLLRRFPGFRADVAARTQDALYAVRFLSELGRIVLLEFSEEEYYVFVDPSKLLHVTKLLTKPAAVVLHRLSRQSNALLRRGLSNADGLATLLHEYDDKTRAVLLDLLCRFDLLIRLGPGEAGGDRREELFGMPILVPSSTIGINCSAKEDQVALRMTTRFADALPLGLRGAIVAHLQQKLGDSGAEPSLLRADIALLSLSGARRIAVGFSSAGRGITWTVVAQDAARLAHLCLSALEELLRDMRGFAGRGFGAVKHFVIAECQGVQQRCQPACSVEFRVPTEWIRSPNQDGKIEDINGECPAGVLWVMSKLLPRLKYR